MTKITGKRLALDLLYYCRKTGDWQPDYANGPLNNLLDVVRDQPNFKLYFDWELLIPAWGSKAVVESEVWQHQEKPIGEKNDAPAETL